MSSKPSQSDTPTPLPLQKAAADAAAAVADAAAATRRNGEMPAPSYDISALWHLLIVRPWTSLAVISADDGMRSWRLVEKLVEVAKQAQYGALKPVNILELSPERVTAVANAVSKVSSLGERKRFVIAIDSPLENPMALRILSVCDAVILVLEKGRSSIPESQRIVEMVGRERLIGAVLASR